MASIPRIEQVQAHPASSCGSFSSGGALGLRNRITVLHVDAASLGLLARGLDLSLRLVIFGDLIAITISRGDDILQGTSSVGFPGAVLDCTGSGTLGTGDRGFGGGLLAGWGRGGGGTGSTFGGSAVALVGLGEAETGSGAGGWGGSFFGHGLELGDAVGDCFGGYVCGLES